MNKIYPKIGRYKTYPYKEKNVRVVTVHTLCKKPLYKKRVKKRVY